MLCPDCQCSLCRACEVDDLHLEGIQVLEASHCMLSLATRSCLQDITCKFNHILPSHLRTFAPSQPWPRDQCRAAWHAKHGARHWSSILISENHQVESHASNNIRHLGMFHILRPWGTYSELNCANLSHIIKAGMIQVSIYHPDAKLSDTKISRILAILYPLGFQKKK